MLLYVEELYDEAKLYTRLKLPSLISHRSISGTSYIPTSIPILESRIHQSQSLNMTVSHSHVLYWVANAYATIVLGFGINAVLRPDHALGMFEFEPPAAPAEHHLVKRLMAIYGVRDIFMGLAIYVAASFGTRKSLGWTLISTCAVALADGVICLLDGNDQWSHWGHGLMIGVLGSILLGVFDRS